MRSNWQVSGERHGDDQRVRRSPQFALRTSFKRPLAVDAREQVPDMGESPIDDLQKRIECDQDGENDHQKRGQGQVLRRQAIKLRNRLLRNLQM